MGNVTTTVKEDPLGGREGVHLNANNVNQCLLDVFYSHSHIKWLFAGVKVICWRIQQPKGCYLRDELSNEFSLYLVRIQLHFGMFSYM